MRILRKFTALITAFCIILTLVNILPVYSLSEEFDYTEFLTDLEIYTAEDNMMYTDDTITREEAASILSIFYGITESSFPVKGVAEDVPENWSSGHISTVVNAGVMSIYEDGLFRPQEFMKVGEVVKMLVVLTGYKVVAENNGGFPTGYLMTAFKNGIVKKVSDLDVNAEITKGEFSKLLYNALTVNILRQSSYSAEHNVFESENDVTLLSENLDIYEAEGLVTALPYTSIDYSTPPGDNIIRIDNTEYEYLKDAAEFLGTNVDLYYRQSDDDGIGRILHMEIDEDKTKVVNIDAADIEKTTLTSVTYSKNNRSETAKLPKKAVVIFNGQRNTYYTPQHLMPAQGSVKLIDAGRNGVYEYVIVESYVNYFVNRVDFSEGNVYITEKSGKKAIMIDTNDDDVYVQVFDRDREVELDCILPGDIISVMADQMDIDKKEVKSESKQFKIYRSDNIVTGAISSIGKDYVMIDDTEYKLAGDFDKNEYSLEIGEQSTFCLNWLGEISAVASVQNSSKYAILQKAKSRSSIDEVIEVKLFDETGTFTVYKCADKLRIDGRSKSDYKDAEAYLKKSSVTFGLETGIPVLEDGEFQLVKYTLKNDGELAELDTVIADKVLSDGELKCTGKMSGEATKGTLIQYTGCINSGNKRFGLSNNTYVFAVGADLTDDDGYRIIPVREFYPEKSPVAFFDANDLNVSKAVLWHGAVSKIDTSIGGKTMVVKDVINQLGSDGIPSVFLEGIMLNTGEEVLLETFEELIKSAKIVPGSFIRWDEDSKGRATLLKNVMTIDGSGETATAAKPYEDFSGGYRVSYGKAYAFDEEHFSIRFYGADGEVLFDEPFWYNNLKRVYIFDSKNKSFEKTDISSVRTEFEHGKEAADTVGTYYNSGRLWTMVIYR